MLEKIVPFPVFSQVTRKSSDFVVYWKFLRENPKERKSVMSIRILEIDTGKEIHAIGAWREDYKSFNTLENNGHSLFDDIPDVRLAKITFDDVSQEWYEVWELPDGYTII